MNERPQRPDRLQGVGVLIRFIEKGDGNTYPKKGDSCLVRSLVYGAVMIFANRKCVKVHYEARLEGGKVFDSSIERKLPFEFQLGSDQVIHGWEAALPNLALGSFSEITVPAVFAYGSEGLPPHVPPNATLIYKIRLLDITGNP